MGITDLIKNSMKYPFSDMKTFLKLGVIITILSIITTSLNYIFVTAIYDVNYESLSVSTNITSFAEASNIAFSNIPTNTWIIIAILSILAIFVSLYILGYHLNVINNAVNKQYILPNFNKPINKIINGFKVAIVSIAYLIIPTILLNLGIIIGGNLTLIFFIIGMILMIYMSLLTPMAIVHMSVNDNKISYAFKFNEIRQIISKISWLRYFGTMFTLAAIIIIITLTAELIVSVIGSAFSVLTGQLFVILIFQTILMGLFVDSYIGLFLNHAIGSLYNEKILDFDIDEEYLI